MAQYDPMAGYQPGEFVEHNDKGYKNINSSFFGNYTEPGTDPSWEPALCPNQKNVNNIRLYTKSQCDAMGGEHRYEECIMPDGGSFSYMCRGLNGVPEPTDPELVSIVDEASFERVKNRKKEIGSAWEYAGLTYAEFVKQLDLHCSREVTKVDYATMDDWWKYVGDKWNSPCPYDLSKGIASRRYQLNDLDASLNAPVCKQWRVWAPNATRSSPGPLGPRIPAKDWNKPEVVNGKWLWQHSTTTASAESGTNIHQYCPLGDFKGDLRERQAELDRYIGPGEHDPADCFLAEKAFIDYMEGVLTQKKNSDVGWMTAFTDKGAKWLIEKGASKITEALVSLIPGGVAVKALAGKAVEEGVKYAMNKVWDKVRDANVEASEDPEEFIKRRAMAPAYEDEALRQAGFPATVLAPGKPGYKIKKESWTDRRITMAEKRRALINALASNPAVYKEKFGYDIMNPYLDAQKVHGGAKASPRETYLSKALKHLAYKFTVDVMERAKGSGKAHAPHAKFAGHLRKLKVSPEAYLAEARRKAKVAGLAWRLLGWSDDGTHKLQIPNEEGRLIHFGSAGMGDHILYTLLKDPTASAHRKSYLARATKIRGDWKKSPYTPNSLAIAVLW
jgi:hypothetical protein